MEVFIVTADPADKTSELIRCENKNLFIRVTKKQEVFSLDALAMTVAIEEKGIQPYDYCFEVLYPSLDPQFERWSMELFYDAIEFYCQSELDAEPDGFQLINLQNFYPYQKDDVTY